MIIRLIILFLLVWLGLRVYRATRKVKSEPVIESKTRDMVSCEKCGIHVPLDEAVKENGKYFCSTNHTNREK